jgi:hypothetical protein
MGQKLAKHDAVRMILMLAMLTMMIHFVMTVMNI